MTTSDQTLGVQTTNNINLKIGANNVYHNVYN